MASVQNFTVYTSAQLSVVQGVNYGDPLSGKADLYLDDCYRLKAKAQPARLTLRAEASGRRHRVAPQSAIGAIGAAVYLDCQITLMSEAGQIVDALIFIEVELGEIKQVYLSAFETMQPDTESTLSTRLIQANWLISAIQFSIPARKSPWRMEASALSKISSLGRRFSPMTLPSKE